jgi:hypothetical protein
MLFRRRFRGQLTSLQGRVYIASGGKNRDSWAGMAIYRAAKKATCYQEGHDFFYPYGLQTSAHK